MYVVAVSNSWRTAEVGIDMMSSDLAIASEGNLKKSILSSAARS